MGSENRQFMPQEDQAKALWLTPSQLEFFEPVILHSHQKLSSLKSVVEFDMNDILYEFKNLHQLHSNGRFPWTKWDFRSEVKKLW